MITLIGDTSLIIKNPKIGNLETVDTGMLVKMSRGGITGSSVTQHTIKKRRFDFEWLKLNEKETLINWLLAHIGRVITVQWVSGGDPCNQQVINEQYIVDDQPLETITVHDNCSYDCMTYWIKV